MKEKNGDSAGLEPKIDVDNVDGRNTIVTNSIRENSPPSSPGI